jgi:hypothetical protein
MATAFDTGATDITAKSEERFFFLMACTVAATIAAGFALNLVLGRSTFAVPLVFHVHAFVFFGWLALFVTQSWLVSSGNIAVHRRLGWLSVIWVPAMVVVGEAMSITSLRRTGGPFFFSSNEFMFGNAVGLLTFAALVGAAVRLRRSTDWHRRLMLGATIAITGPGFGRLLPMPLVVPWAWEIGNLTGLVFVFVAMRRDRRVHGRVHPAWLVVTAAIVGSVVLGEILANTAWGIDLTRQIVAGYPGAAPAMAPYMP